MKNYPIFLHAQNRVLSYIKKLNNASIVQLIKVYEKPE